LRLFLFPIPDVFTVDAFSRLIEEMFEVIAFKKLQRITVSPEIGSVIPYPNFSRI
jgi:hypothetical protein